MKKIGLFLIIILLVTLHTGLSNAQTFTAFLNAGSSTIQAGLDIEHTLDQGYMRTGLSGFHFNHDHGKIKMLEGHVAIGNDILMEGLTGELGIKGLIGTADKRNREGDLGSLGFMIGGIYQLPINVFPVSTKIFAEMSWTPGPLAFIDMDGYFDMKAGVDVFIVEHAAMEFSYQRYNMDMTEGPGDWTRKENIFTIGVKLKF